MSKNNKLNNEWTGTYIFFVRSANGIAQREKNVQKNGSSLCTEAIEKIKKKKLNCRSCF